MPKATWGPQCVLRQVWLLFLFLGVAYIMTGSVLLLQCSSPPAQHKVTASPLPWISVTSRARAINGHTNAASYAQSTFKAPAPLVQQKQKQKHVKSAKVIAKVVPSWLASRNLEIRRFRRHRIHTLAAEQGTQIEQNGPRRSVRPTGNYIGCYSVKPKKQTLNGTVFYDYRKMSSILCQKACSESGFHFAGLRYGAECRCGHHIGGHLVQDQDCMLGCRLEEGASCKGVDRLSIYKVEQLPPDQNRFRHMQYRGCFKRPENGALAIVLHLNQSNMTVPSCIEICTRKGLPLVVLSILDCFCSYSSPLFPLHQPVDEWHCALGVGAVVPSHYRVYQTSVPDSRCAERSFLPEKSNRLVALSSFPGAGNTWLRHLIELATGYYTGSFYFDSMLFKKGFKGEKDHWKSGRTVCVKTHESSRGDIEMFDAAVLLIRNPYRCLMAEFNRKSAGHLGHASEQHWESSEWPEFVASHAPWWASHVLNWLKFGQRVLVIHYEDLLSRELVSQLRLITSFLNVSTAAERLQCAEDNHGGFFRRPAIQRLPGDPFTAEMRQQIDSYIRIVDRALRSARYGGLPSQYLPR